MRLNNSKAYSMTSAIKGLFCGVNFDKHKIIPTKNPLPIVILFLLAFSFLSNAQVSIAWSNAPGGDALAVDQLHNVYSAIWDYNPGGDITLTKRNTNGVVLWNATYNNTDNSRHEVVTWLETDNQNNCLVAGTIRSGYSNPVNAASLLMKYDSLGNLLWRKVFESSFEGSYTRKILVDGADNIYVLGLGTGSNGQVTRVKKFDPNGISLWTYYDVHGIGAPINIKFAPDNTLLVMGRGITGIINGYLKLSLTGNLIWAKSGITSSTVGDASGDSFGNTYIINADHVTSAGGSILKKYDPSGLLIWSHTNSMAGTKVETGSDENPIISGFPNVNTGGAAFMKYSSSGTVLWQNLNADGPEILLLHGILKLDAFNNAYLSAGNLFNMAVCKINSDGTYGWVGLVSGSNSARSMRVDSDNSVYIIGTTAAKLAQLNSISILNLVVFIEGYFAGSGTMHPVMMNQGYAGFPLSSINDVDKITVELHNSIAPYSLVATTTTRLKRNGAATCSFPPVIGNYYIVVKHRNGLQTWSQNPVSFALPNVYYNFSTAAYKAYGNNMVEVEPGVWALYSGDILIDENIDLWDFSLLDADIASFIFGYVSTDLDGDGSVDLLDRAMLENNVLNFIYTQYP